MKKSVTCLLFSLLALSFMVTSVNAQSGAAQQDANPAEQASAPAQQAQAGTVYDVIVSDPSLSSFELLVEAAALADNLDQAGPFTVFAPTNEAWAAFEAMNAEEPQTDATLTQILLHHIVNGSYPASAVAARDSVPTLLGEFVSFGSDSGVITLDDGAEITTADLGATNGVVHLIDTVLVPPIHSLATSRLGSRDQTIAEVLENDGRFETLLVLMEQASLLDELRNPNARHTLFAPTDEAIDAVPEDIRDEWLSPGNAAFVEIMAYHLVSDELGINQLATDDLVPTLEGRPLMITTDDQLGVYVNENPITEFNIVASNGVIHVVDGVLIP
jgi:transforming growth factor-beta-induced protein